MHRKPVQDPFLTQNSYCIQEIVLKNRYFERVLSESYKKVNLILPFKPNFFNEQGHEKQKKPETSDQSLVRLLNFRKIP